MLMKTKILFLLVTFIATLGFQSCCKCDHEPELITVSGTTDFKVVNNAATPITTASSFGANVTINVNTTIIVNGETVTYNKTVKGNELPAAAGNEIEITFNPSQNNETAIFRMPDGESIYASNSSRSFKWTVPDDMYFPATIKATSSYEKEGVKYENEGSVILIPV